MKDLYAVNHRSDSGCDDCVHNAPDRGCYKFRCFWDTPEVPGVIPAGEYCSQYESLRPFISPDWENLPRPARKKV